MTEKNTLAKILTLFSWAPAVYFQWLKRHHMPGKVGYKILRGEKGYAGVPAEGLGPMRSFFDLEGRL